MHVVLSPAILKRNPHFAFTETVENVAKRLGGEQLDLQPDLEFALFSPDVPHLGTGVASYHPPTG